MYKYHRNVLFVVPSIFLLFPTIMRMFGGKKLLHTTECDEKRALRKVFILIVEKGKKISQ